MYYTYLLQSNKDHQFYTGYTADLQKRRAMHYRPLPKPLSVLNPSLAAIIPQNLITLSDRYADEILDNSESPTTSFRIKAGSGKRSNAKKVFSTKSRVPFTVVYYEACLNEADARARERYLKSGMGKRYLKNRIKTFLISNGVDYEK